jgi:hypothetical protein
MKKRGWYLLVVSAVSLAGMTACEVFEDCGTCEMVTEYADGSQDRTAPVLLCGDELDEKLDYYEESPDGTAIWWDCN